MTYTIYPAANTSAPGSYTFVDGYQLIDEAGFQSGLLEFKGDAESLKDMGYETVVLVQEDEDGNQEVIATA